MHALIWRYGNGGGDLGDRPGRLVLNGEVARESLSFPHTGDWTNWMETDTVWVELAEGYNSIRLEAFSASGLGNIEYLKVAGADIAFASCVPIYVLEVGHDDPVNWVSLILGQRVIRSHERFRRELRVKWPREIYPLTFSVPATSAIALTS